MRLPLLLLTSLFVLPLLSACSKKDDFANNHEQAMKQIALVSNGVRESSVTIDLLAPSDPIAVISEDVTYGSGFRWFFVQPTQPNNYPGVIMIHERWWLNDNIKDMAKALATYGYSVLAVDLYDGVVTNDAKQAAKLMQSFDQNRGIDNLKAADHYLRTVRIAPKVASLWWCFGGAQSLQAAINIDDLDATVMYYGRIVQDKDQLANITHPILGFFGEEDNSIPVSDVEALSATLSGQQTDYSIVIYPGVGHAFANPTGPNFSEKETIDARDKTLRFLKQNLYDN